MAKLYLLLTLHSTTSRLHHCRRGRISASSAQAHHYFITCAQLLSRALFPSTPPHPSPTSLSPPLDFGYLDSGDSPRSVKIESDNGSYNHPTSTPILSPLHAPLHQLIRIRTHRVVVLSLKIDLAPCHVPRSHRWRRRSLFLINPPPRPLHLTPPFFLAPSSNLPHQRVTVVAMLLGASRWLASRSDPSAAAALLRSALIRSISTPSAFHPTRSAPI